MAHPTTANKQPPPPPSPHSRNFKLRTTKLNYTRDAIELALTPSLLRPSRRGFQSLVSRLDEPIERVLLNRSRFPVRRAVHEVLQTAHGGDGTDDDRERGYRFDRLSIRCRRRRRYRRQSNFSCSSKTSFIHSFIRAFVRLSLFVATAASSRSSSRSSSSSPSFRSFARTIARRRRVLL